MDRHKGKKFFLISAIIVAACTIMSIATKREKEKAKADHRHIPYGPYEAFFKRPLDVALSVVALIILSPVILITAILVKMNLGSPVLFIQDRPGLNERIFTLYKFRTMLSPKNGIIKAEDDAERLTPFGDTLRATSLDELPELVNIVKGDMSIVGPRPLLTQYLSRYNEHQARRHDVRPGLTGLAQVHGRNAVSWEEKFDWDVRYVEQVTFAGDIKIILETIKMVIKRDGISAAGEVTVSEFMGSEE